MSEVLQKKAKAEAKRKIQMPKKITFARMQVNV